MRIGGVKHPSPHHFSPTDCSLYLFYLTANIGLEIHICGCNAEFCLINKSHELIRSCSEGVEEISTFFFGGGVHLSSYYFRRSHGVHRQQSEAGLHKSKSHSI